MAGVSDPFLFSWIGLLGDVDVCRMVAVALVIVGRATQFAELGGGEAGRCCCQEVLSSPSTVTVLAYRELLASLHTRTMTLKSRGSVNVRVTVPPAPTTACCGAAVSCPAGVVVSTTQ